MAKVSFRTLRVGDLRHIAENLRQADRDELVAATGRYAPLEDIALSILRSSQVWIMDDGEPIAVFGVVPVSLLSGVGSPWMLGTDRCYRHPRALVVEGRRYVSQMRAVFPHLYNYVDARNDMSIRWLQRLGFEMQPAAPYGPSGALFHRFDSRAE